MKLVQVLEVGKVEAGLLSGLAEIIPKIFPVRCQILPKALDPAPTFHGERQQYHSSELLELIQKMAVPGCWRLLGVTSVDLYIPILTFVFGEAQLGGTCALASYHRLRQELYGLAPDPTLLRERLFKEALHELGHTAGLTHCEDYRCVMSSSHSVELVDLKEAELCQSCRQRACW